MLSKKKVLGFFVVLFFLGLGIAQVCVTLASASSQQAAQSAGEITLQVVWANDGTYVNGRKVSDTWVSINPPQQQPQQNIVSLPASPTSVQKEEPVVETDAMTELAAIAAPVPNTLPESSELVSLPKNELIPLPPAVAPEQKKTCSEKPAVVTVRRGLFGQRRIVYTPCKLLEGEKASACCELSCKSSCSPSDVATSSVVKTSKRTEKITDQKSEQKTKRQRRFGNGRLLNFLFR
jgi:hypothetical protein